MTKRKPNPQDLLLELTALRIERDRTEQRIRDAIAMCRQPNVYEVPMCSWQSIADAMNVTRQAVMQRYADRTVRSAGRRASTTTRSGAKGRQA